MANKKNGVALTVIALVAFVALVSGLFVSQYMHKKKKIDESQFHGTLLNHPREVNSFALTGIDEQPFNNAKLQGQWTMMFFGFTNCGYLCPTTMAELGKMYRLLEEKGAKTLPKVVMISIDPQRDDLEKLAHYVHAFNSNFYGARGDKSTIKAMTREMGIAYAKVALKDNKDSENYDIEHTGTVLLFNPQGQLIAFFTVPHQADSLANDYLLLAS
ncbi:SCO family protein [Legionella oakridgensis]|uniref:Protein SCO1/SenC/PrrC, involved in biogenesis of respiratory and photosynthetic systems n=2 Tax=Legionella oakridgensis TaxID=29423 RepID=W0BHR8_9GAMM|nr:SCO family protein [Legionella oakridgensis]AHE67954.1 protein SCO1/SenC/PrrC, involved in biogenesis of respiratory and photosynthetic systems [Legionella oakridgensis ATCC 33761 = DSM 21215]KTD38770.1 SCO1/SenC family transporter protein [Legionella oakridgensis]STY20954.1 SCO1/SenC family protein [Legionella longbeachae]